VTAIIINPYAMTPGIAAATREYRALKTVASSSSRFVTATGVDIGSAAVGREVVLVVYCKVTGLSPESFVGATIGGVAATVHINVVTSTYHNYATAIISAPLDSGSTATVELEFTSGGATYEVWIASYKVLGLLSRTATDTASNTGTTTAVASKSVTIDAVDDGLLFAGMLEYQSGPGAFALTGVTENYDSGVASFTAVVGGSLEVTATESNRTVTFQISSGVFYGQLVAVAFR